MGKDLLESRKMDDIRVRSIGRLAVERNLTYKEAEELYNNDMRAKAIAELAASTDISYKDAEKYHDKMVATTKLLIIKDKMKTIITTAEKLQKLNGVDSAYCGARLKID